MSLSGKFVTSYIVRYIEFKYIELYESIAGVIFMIDTVLV